MRHGRAHEGDFQHAGEPDVGDVLALAEQEPAVFLARKTRADAFRTQAAAASGGRIDASES